MPLSVTQCPGSPLRCDCRAAAGSNSGEKKSTLGSPNANCADIVRDTQNAACVPVIPSQCFRNSRRKGSNAESAAYCAMGHSRSPTRKLLEEGGAFNSVGS